MHEPLPKIFQIHSTEKKVIKKLNIEDLVGLKFSRLVYFNLSALFFNSSIRSIRLVVEDLGVYEVFEKPSAFDDYENESD